MQEKLDELEKSFIRMEGTVGTLVDKMSDVASSLGVMSKAISAFAVMDTKIEIVSSDVSNVASMCRTNKQEIDAITKSISDKSEHHTEQCNINIDNSEQGLKSDIKWYLAGVFSLITVVFYFALSTATTVQEVKDIVTENKTSISHINKVFDRHITDFVEYKKETAESFKRANGHRFHLNKETVDAK